MKRNILVAFTDKHGKIHSTIVMDFEGVIADREDMNRLKEAVNEQFSKLNVFPSSVNVFSFQPLEQPL